MMVERQARYTVLGYVLLLLLATGAGVMVARFENTQSALLVIFAIAALIGVFVQPLSTFMLTIYLAGLISSRDMLTHRLVVLDIPINIIDVLFALVWLPLFALLTLRARHHSQKLMRDPWLGRLLLSLAVLAMVGLITGLLRGNPVQDVFSALRHLVLLIIGSVVASSLLRWYRSYSLRLIEIFVCVGLVDTLRAMLVVQERIRVAGRITMDSLQASGSGSGAALYASLLILALLVSGQNLLGKRWLQYLAVFLVSLNVVAFTDSPTSLFAYVFALIVPIGVILFRGQLASLTPFMFRVGLLLCLVAMGLLIIQEMRSGMEGDTLQILVSRALALSFSDAIYESGLDVRHIFWRAALDLMADHPMLAYTIGLGLGTTVPFVDLGTVIRTNWGLPGALGFYLGSLGPIGAALFILLLLRLGYLGLRVYLHHPQHHLRAYGLGFFSYFTLQIILSPIHGNFIAVLPSVLTAFVIGWLDAASDQPSERCRI